MVYGKYNMVTKQRLINDDGIWWKAEHEQNNETVGIQNIIAQNHYTVGKGIRDSGAYDGRCNNELW